MKRHLFFMPLQYHLWLPVAVFLMWLGEQITERGIGNGISMLIFAGIMQACQALLDKHSNLPGRVI